MLSGGDSCTGPVLSVDGGAARPGPPAPSPLTRARLPAGFAAGAAPPGSRIPGSVVRPGPSGTTALGSRVPAAAGPPFCPLPAHEGDTHPGAAVETETGAVVGAGTQAARARLAPRGPGSCAGRGPASAGLSARPPGPGGRGEAWAPERRPSQPQCPPWGAGWVTACTVPARAAGTGVCPGRRRPLPAVLPGPGLPPRGPLPAGRGRLHRGRPGRVPRTPGLRPVPAGDGQAGEPRASPASRGPAWRGPLTG